MDHHSVLYFKIYFSKFSIDECIYSVTKRSRLQLIAYSTRTGIKPWRRSVTFVHRKTSIVFPSKFQKFHNKLWNCLRACESTVYENRSVKVKASHLNSSNGFVAIVPYMNRDDYIFSVAIDGFVKGGVEVDASLAQEKRFFHFGMGCRYVR